MKSEVRRGRKFVEYHDPETQDEFTFTQEISGADVSYQETDGSWLPADENWQTDGLDGFSFRAHRMNHKVRFDSIGAWRWYPRRNVETEYIVINRPQCWLTATKRWGNLLVNGISREGRDITLTSVRKVTRVIHSRWNGIKTDWILLDNTAPTKFRQKIDLVGLTELDGWLYGADGERLAQLTPTTAIDANEVELPCSGVYEGGYLQFEADVTGAVYPVTIDPDFSGTSEDGDMFVSVSVPLRCYGGSNQQLSISGGHSFLRFILSSIASDSVISSATLKVYKTNAVDTTRPRSTTIYQVSSANGDWIEGITSNATAKAGEPCFNAKEADGSGGVTTAWAGSAGARTAGTDYVNTALTDTVNMDRVNDVGTEYVFTFNADGKAVLESWFGDATNNGLIIFENVASSMFFGSSENTTTAYRPVLSVTYTGGSTGTLLRVNMNAQMQSLTGGFN